MSDVAYQREGITIYHGDCLEIMPGLDAESFDMIWTDPPFGHGNMDGDLQAARVRDGVKGARVTDAEPIANDIGIDFEKVIIGFIEQSARMLKRDCCCCCCMAGGGPTPTFAKVAQWIDEKLEFFQAVVWDKSARGNGMGWRYRRNYEFVMVSHRKGGRLAWADDSSAVPNVLRYMPVIQRQHPNEKPVGMISDFIKWHTRDGDAIIDPFMGSGSTLVAAIRTGRKCIGIELERKYVDIAIKRCEAEFERTALIDRVPTYQQQTMEGVA